MKKVNYYIAIFLIFLLDGSNYIKSMIPARFSAEESAQKEVREKRYNDLKNILQGLNFKDIAENNIKCKINSIELNEKLEHKDIFSFWIDQTPIGDGQKSLNGVVSLIPPVDLHDIVLNDQAQARVDYDNFFKQYFHAVCFYFLKYESRGLGLLSYESEIYSEDIYNLIDDIIATQNSDKLIWISRFFLTHQLYEIRTHAYSKEEDLNEEKGSLSTQNALKEITKYLNYALYATRKLYQKYPTEFAQEEVNTPNTNNLYKIFDEILLPYNNESFLIESQNIPPRVRDYISSPYDIAEMNQLRNKFFEIVKEGKIKQFRRDNPKTFYMLMAGVGYGLYQILALLYQKGYLPESWKNYIDKKINAN